MKPYHTELINELLTLLIDTQNDKTEFNISHIIMIGNCTIMFELYYDYQDNIIKISSCNINDYSTIFDIYVGGQNDNILLSKNIETDNIRIDIPCTPKNTYKIKVLKDCVWYDIDTLSVEERFFLELQDDIFHYAESYVKPIFNDGNWDRNLEKCGSFCRVVLYPNNQHKLQYVVDELKKRYAKCLAVL